MKMLSLSQAEKLVSSNRSASWDGWTVLLHTPSNNAFMFKDAQFINGKWGRVVKVSPNTKGEYAIPNKFAKNV